MDRGDGLRRPRRAVHGRAAGSARVRARVKAVGRQSLSHGRNVNSARIVLPETGAKRLTLNYSVSEPGYEFPQHVHDGSDDTFLVRQGEVDVRQGERRAIPTNSAVAAMIYDFDQDGVPTVSS